MSDEEFAAAVRGVQLGNHWWPFSMEVGAMEDDVVHSTYVRIKRWSLICQRPNRGSRWYYGNFSLGLMIDSHPRFVNVILGLVFVEIGVAWTNCS
jgi:hypothetical protein